MHKAPFSWQLTCKLESMARHLHEAPGPWFDELLQPGGWTSDLRDGLNISVCAEGRDPSDLW